MQHTTNNFKLTKQEIKIIKYIRDINGGGKEMADYFRISIRTIESHLRSIHVKTVTHNYADIVRFAHRHPFLFEENIASANF